MRRLISILFFLLFIIKIEAEESSFDFILRDVCETIIEENPSIDIESVEEQLRDIAAHPINLNTATSDQLEQLYFLSPEQVDALLLYVYKHPIQSVYELQLIYGFQDYEIRNLLPFVYAGPSQEKDERTLADLFRYAQHEVDIRLDARNLENYSGDPIYSSVKYKLNAGKKILMGATLGRSPGEVPNVKSRYGAYIQLNDVWRFKTIIAGDYRANFGLGLIMNSSLPLGKSSLAANIGLTQQGLRKYNGTSSDFMRGIGATMNIGNVDISAFYSFRLPDSLYRQTAGLNVSYKKNRFRFGATAVEYWVKDSLPYRSTYYNTNYFRGTNQLSVSLNAQYAFKKVYLLGEIAASQNYQWGIGALAGLRYSPVQDISLLALYRYFSPTYDAVYASTFSETTKPNDEQGAYIGADIRRLKKWRFSVYSDFFAFSGPKYTIRNKSWGYDLYGEADYLPSAQLDMSWRFRTKRKGQKDLYSFRYQLNNSLPYLSFRTQLDANICQTDEGLSYGVQIFEQAEYNAKKIPLTAQLRLEGFYIPSWNNRIYTYENDVLYAFSIPSSYGIGARYYLNMRYHISDHYSLYLRASDTWYSKKWAEQQSLASCHKTDIHLLLRITY